MGYNRLVIEVCQTNEYARWFDKLRDARARAKILVRVRRLSLGNPGDVQPVGEGISELRIDYGPGYRIYFKSQGTTIIVLLIGGNKRTQKHNIERAKELARDL